MFFLESDLDFYIYGSSDFVRSDEKARFEAVASNVNVHATQPNSLRVNTRNKNPSIAAVASNNRWNAPAKQLEFTTVDRPRRDDELDRGNGMFHNARTQLISRMHDGSFVDRLPSNYGSCQFPETLATASLSRAANNLKLDEASQGLHWLGCRGCNRCSLWIDPSNDARYDMAIYQSGINQDINQRKSPAIGIYDNIPSASSNVLRGRNCSRKRLYSIAPVSENFMCEQRDKREINQPMQFVPNSVDQETCETFWNTFNTMRQNGTIPNWMISGNRSPQHNASLTSRPIISKLKSSPGRPPISKKLMICYLCQVNETAQWRYLDGTYRVCNRCFMKHRKYRSRKVVNSQKNPVLPQLSHKSDASSRYPSVFDSFMCVNERDVSLCDENDAYSEEGKISSDMGKLLDRSKLDNTLHSNVDSPTLKKSLTSIIYDSTRDNANLSLEHQKGTNKIRTIKEESIKCDGNDSFGWNEKNRGINHKNSSEGCTPFFAEEECRINAVKHSYNEPSTAENALESRRVLGEVTGLSDESTGLVLQCKDWQADPSVECCVDNTFDRDAVGIDNKSTISFFPKYNNSGNDASIVSKLCSNWDIDSISANEAPHEFGFELYHDPIDFSQWSIIGAKFRQNNSAYHL